MNKTRRLLAKQLIGVCAILFLTFKAIATDVVFDLSAFGASPTTNRTVTLQTLSPFPGNLRFFTSDSNGMFTFTNAPASLYQGYIKAPPAQIPFKILVTATNLGAVAADTITVADSTATFPAGAVAWSALTSDSRYARDTNFVITGFQPAAANLTNWAGAQTNQYQRTNPVISSLISVGVFATNTLLAGANISLSTNSSGVVTITSSGGGSATNAIGNFNGFGTNTTVVTNFTATNITGSVAAFSIINTPNLVGIDIGANGTNDPGSIGSVVIASAGSAIQRAGVGHAAIVAGQNNRIGAGPNATGSVILGGSVNIISNQSSIIAGGANNFIGGSHSFLAGGDNIIVAGDDSVGLGSKATANHNNTFIWNDGSATFASTAGQQFLVQAGNGMAVNTNNPGTNALNVNGNIMAKSFSIPGNQTPFVESPTNSGTDGQVVSKTGGDTKWVDQTGSGGSTSVTPGNTYISMLTNAGTVTIFGANQTNVYAQTRWTTNNDTIQINGRNVTNVIAFGVSSAVTNQWRVDFTNATINVDNFTVVTNNDADTFKVNTNFVVVTNTPRALYLTNANNLLGGTMTNGGNAGNAFYSHGSGGSTSEQFGQNASTTGTKSLAIGTDSSVGGSSSMAAGYRANASSVGSIAFGANATNSAQSSIAFGTGATVSGNLSIAFGSGASSAFAGSIAFGPTVANTADNQILMGLTNQNVVFPGNALFVSNATVVGNATFSGNAAFAGNISNRTSVITNLNVGANVALRESTNVVSVKAAGSTFVNGLFRRKNGLCLTNYNGVLLTNIAGVNYLQSNNVTMYSSATLDNATWTQVSGVVPVPSSTLGVEFDADSILLNGTLTASNTIGGSFRGQFGGDGAGLSNITFTSGASFVGNGAGLTNLSLNTNSTTWYVSLTGNDASAKRGRSDLPYASGAKAISNAAAGDTIFFYKGTHLITASSSVPMYFGTNLTIRGEGPDTTKLLFVDTSAPGPHTSVFLYNNDSFYDIHLQITNSFTYFLISSLADGANEIGPTNVFDHCTLQGVNDILVFEADAGIPNCFIKNCKMITGWDAFASFFNGFSFGTSNSIIRIEDTDINCDIALGDQQSADIFNLELYRSLYLANVRMRVKGGTANWLRTTPVQHPGFGANSTLTIQNVFLDLTSTNPVESGPLGPIKEWATNSSAIYVSGFSYISNGVYSSYGSALPLHLRASITTESAAYVSGAFRTITNYDRILQNGFSYNALKGTFTNYLAGWYDIGFSVDVLDGGTESFTAGIFTNGVQAGASSYANIDTAASIGTANHLGHGPQLFYLPSNTYTELKVQQTGTSTFNIWDAVFNITQFGQ